jgi:hypothetical protein
MKNHNIWNCDYIANFSLGQLLSSRATPYSPIINPNGREQTIFEMSEGNSKSYKRPPPW